MTAVRRRPGAALARPRTGAERQRERRQRVKLCAASYRCDVGPAVIDMLIKRKYLAAGEEGDGREVGHAVSLFLADHAALDEA